jgi:hypothetical protein
VTDSSIPQPEFPKLNLPEPPLQIQKSKAQKEYFDIFRSQWLLLTPEEWVRQHALFWLMSQSGWPKELISIERLIPNSRKRMDILAFDRQGKPALLVECKAFDEEINQETARQAFQYNQKLACPFVWLTNGQVHLVYKTESGVYNSIGHLPDFQQINR